MGRRKNNLPRWYPMDVFLRRVGSPSPLEYAGSVMHLLSACGAIGFGVVYLLGPDDFLFPDGWKLPVLLGLVYLGLGIGVGGRRISKRRVKRWTELHCPGCCYPLPEDEDAVRCAECGLKSTPREIRAWWKRRYNIIDPEPWNIRIWEKDGPARDTTDQKERRP